MKRKPIIITGHARSGTTALCDLLNIDGRLFITNESHSFLPEMEEVQTIYINLQWTGTVHRMIDLFERHGLSWADLMPYNFRRSMFNDWLDANLPDSVEYIGDKTPRPYIYAIDQIMARSAPETKIIICMRDARDSIISKFWGKNAWPYTNITVESWINCAVIMRDYLLSHHKNKCLIVKYEDSCEDPQKTVEEISEFLGLSSCLKIDGHNYKPVNKEGWKKTYPDMTKQISQNYPEFPGLLEFYGYE